MSQECYNGVTTVLQRCHKSAAGAVLSLTNHRHKDVQGCYKGVVKVLGHYKGVTRVLQGVTRVL
jgi:hypothetical protein